MNQMYSMAHRYLPRSPVDPVPAQAPSLPLRDRWSLTLPGPIGRFAWSPSGRQLVVATLDGHVAILDGRRGQPLAELRAPAGPCDGPGGLAWSPCGERLAVGDGEGYMQALSPATGQPLWRHRLADAPITHLAWSPCGNFLAAATDEAVILYEPTSDPAGPVRTRVARLAGPVRCLFWLPGTSRLVAAGDLGLHVIIPRPRPGPGPEPEASVSVQWLKHPPGTLLGAAPSPDGRLVAAGLSEGGMRLWHMETGEVRTLAGPAGSARRIAWGAAGTLLAATDDSPAIAVWTLFEGRVLEDVPWRLRGHRGQVHGIGFLGAQLCSAGDDGVLRCWRQQPNAWRCTRSEHVGWPVQDLALTPATRSVAAVGADGRVWGWQR
jgi:WD40 repeat protein